MMSEKEKETKQRKNQSGQQLFEFAFFFESYSNSFIAIYIDEAICISIDTGVSMKAPPRRVFHFSLCNHCDRRRRTRKKKRGSKKRYEE